MENITVGQRVKCVKNYNNIKIVGISGEVIYIEKRNALVEFDYNIFNGHDGFTNGNKYKKTALQNNCWYFPVRKNGSSDFLELENPYVVDLI